MQFNRQSLASLQNTYLHKMIVTITLKFIYIYIYGNNNICVNLNHRLDNHLLSIYMFQQTYNNIQYSNI